MFIIIDMRYLIDSHHGFGDVLHFVPAINSIKKDDADANIVMLMSTQANIDVFRTQNLADSYVLLRPSELLKYRLKRIGNKFDYGIIAPCIQNKRKSAILLKLLGCKKIIKEDGNLEEERIHRVDRNNALIEKLGITVNDRIPHMFIPDLEKEYAQNEFAKIKTDSRKFDVCVAICMGGNLETLKKGREIKKVDVKRWPSEYFHILIRMILDKYPDIHIILIGAPKDSEEFWSYEGSNRIKKEEVYDYMGKTSMIQSGALLQCCDFAFGNDTGMIHFAAALGKPTFTVFCSTDPKKIGAYSDNAVYIEEEMDCKYCYLSEKTFMCEERKCITQIKPAVVFDCLNSFIDSISISMVV